MRIRPAPSAAGVAASPLNFDGNFSKAAISSPSAATDASLIADYNYVGGIAGVDRLQLVASPSRHEGSLALRVETRTGDTDGGNGTTGSDRTEYTATNKPYSNGDEVWMARSIFFPVGTPAPTGFYLFQQMFAQQVPGVGGGGSPPFALEVHPSRALMVTVRGGVKALAGDASTHVVSAPVAFASQGVWHDFLVHIRWATAATGLVEVWHREAGGAWSDLPDFSDASAVNVTTLAGVVLSMYPETGQYRASQPATSIVYDGGLQIRATRREAEACFAGAQPVPNRSARVLVPGAGKAFSAYDEFDDGALAPDITLSSAGIAVERGNEILVTGTLDASNFAFSKVKKPALVLTGKRLITEMVDYVPLSQGSSGLQWELSSSNFASMQVTGSYNGAIVFPTTKESNSSFNQGSGWPAYDPTLHRFLSIREAGGTIFFETSPDCRTWTTIWSRVVTGGLTPASSGTPCMYAGWYNVGSATTRVTRFGMYAVEQ